MPTGHLKSYRGSYNTIVAGDAVSLTFVGEDLAIYFTTAAKTNIKVKIDGVYQTVLLWHTGFIYATNNIFDVSYSANQIIRRNTKLLILIFGKFFRYLVV